MGYVMQVLEDVVALKWLTPEKQDGATILDAVKMAADRCHRNVVLLMVMNDDTAMLTPAVAQELDALLPTLQEYVRSTHCVVRSTKPLTKARVVSKVVMGFTGLPDPKQRGRFQIHGTVQEALDAQELAPLMSLVEISLRLTRAGISV